MLPEHVVLMKPNSVYTTIRLFLEKKEDKSENTKEAYEQDIKQFFQLTRDKTLEQLVPEDLTYTADEVENYQLALKRHYSGSSVNRKMSTITTLFKRLRKSYSEYIDLSFFEIERLDYETQKYGSLTQEEFFMIIKLAENLDNGLEKSIFIELSGRTSIRLTALLNLRWSDIKPEQDFYTVYAIDKGKKLDMKPISASFYEKMLQLQEKSVDDKIFSLSARTMERTIKTLCDTMGIDHNVKSEEHPNGRNITVHSLKKTGVEYILQTTGDITLAAKQANHKNIQTTYNTYIEETKKQQLTHLAGLHMGEEIDLSFLKHMSKKEIIKMLMSGDDSLKTKVRQLAQAMQEN